jgi:hypothetical protein
MKVSIISLIYQSARLADWVHDSVHRHTPMIHRGEAEFFFVANDPTPGLLHHLQRRGYRHIVNTNRPYSDAELFAHGYGAPEYMSRVYRGYNEGILAAEGDHVVLINSDNAFSPDWLENLLKYADRSRVIASTLVERAHPVYGVFPGAVHGEFGSDPESYDEDGFLSFATLIRKTGLSSGGAYMPVLLPRDLAIEAGLYPCGNIAGASFTEVARYGDEAFFDALKALGVDHYSAQDSVVYHLKEGERDDTADAGRSAAETPACAATPGTPIGPYPTTKSIVRVLDSMPPTKRHEALMLAVSSDDERRAREAEAAAVAADNTAGLALEAQAQRLRRGVERVAGARHADKAMRAIHSVSWTTRPLRHYLARRRATRPRD